MCVCGREREKKRVGGREGGGGWKGAGTLPAASTVSTTCPPQAHGACRQKREKEWVRERVREREGAKKKREREIRMIEGKDGAQDQTGTRSTRMPS